MAGVESTKQSVVMWYRNLNFGQAVSVKLLKIRPTIVGVDTILVFLDIDLTHHPPCWDGIQPMSQQIADAAGADVVLFVVTGVNTTSSVSSHESRKQFHISERINILLFAKLSSCS